MGAAEGTCDFDLELKKRSSVATILDKNSYTSNWIPGVSADAHMHPRTPGKLNFKFSGLVPLTSVQLYHSPLHESHTRRGRARAVRSLPHFPASNRSLESECIDPDSAPQGTRQVCITVAMSLPNGPGVLCKPRPALEAYISSL